VILVDIRVEEKKKMRQQSDAKGKKRKQSAFNHLCAFVSLCIHKQTNVELEGSKRKEAKD
jgi:hypothetical protein